MSRFLRDSNGRVHLDRLDNGMVACCLCFKWCTLGDLHHEDGDPVDVCHDCERQEVSARKYVWAFRNSYEARRASDG